MMVLLWLCVFTVPYFFQTAVITSTLKAIDIMRKDKGGNGGTVINISSIAGLSQSHFLPIYFATKSAVIQFSNCIGVSYI